MVELFIFLPFEDRIIDDQMTLCSEADVAKCKGEWELAVRAYLKIDTS